MAAKVFEVNDVLPATTQLKISWTFPFEDDDETGDIWISVYVNNDTFELCGVGLYSTDYPPGSIEINRELVYSGRSWVSPYTSSSGNHNYIIIDTSSWSESERTVSYIQISASYTGESPFYWEDLNALPQGYTITYEENGGTTQTDLTGQTNLPNPLPVPTKENHTFFGWYYDSDFANQAFAGDPLTGDVILYAKWYLTSGPKPFEVGAVLPATTQLRIAFTNLNAEEFSMSFVYSNNNSTFILDNGIVLSSISITYGPHGYEVYLPPYDTQKYVDIDTSNFSLEERTISHVGGNAHFMTWEDVAPALTGYTIIFNSNGGTTFSDIEEATELPTLPIPTKSGHIFVGWYYDSDFTNEAFAGDPLTGDVTLYAKWELNTYTITYNSNGGSSIPQTSDATQLPNPLPIPTKPGYTFVNWYYDSAFTQIASPGDTIESNITLYAKWELNTYTITYNSNGGSSIPQTSNVTQLPSELPIPTKIHNTFVGWYYDSTLKQKAKPNDTINTNVTLYAKWYDSLSAFYTDIANLIREFENSSDNIKVIDFADRLRALLESV